MEDELETMSLQTILTRWPGMAPTFIQWRLRCLGCPIAGFHDIADAAREHGYEASDLKRAIRLLIDRQG